jgi:hypothetical protein
MPYIFAEYYENFKFNCLRTIPVTAWAYTFILYDVSWKWA